MEPVRRRAVEWDVPKKRNCLLPPVLVYRRDLNLGLVTTPPMDISDRVEKEIDLNVGLLC